ncbi:MAG: hypothetical protein IKU25_05300 [Clostridia bacterium]|nr:hypothetical protein [Clostridia bacterium]
MQVASHREIGSEYWDIPRGNDDIFPENTAWFLSGRSALSFVIQDIKKRYDVKNAALPVWCCDSMIIPFVNEGIEVLFYDKESPKCDVLLTMEYFGYIRNKPIDFDGVIIYDVTHSLFSPNMGIRRGESKDEYFFGSLRKWTGAKTGGFAGKFDSDFSIELPEKTDEAYIALRTTAMKEKAEYINGKSDDKGYLNFFADAEEMLENGGVYAAYSDDVVAARNLDADFIRTRRRENAEVLLNTVSDIALFKEIQADDVPLFVPIVLPKCERDALKKHLIENKVFCPVHWPYSKWHGEKSDIYDTELSLVCDQRYTKEDMEYICSIIKEFRRCDK